ncbi:MAG: alpha/beta fold hydrolase [Planctomycetota bacterium]|jgi:proline iminopeptidase
MWVEINGTRLYVEIAGEGMPILTLHGGPGIGDLGDNKKMFAPLEEDFRFIYYDQRGNGQSEDAPVETYTHEQYVADAEALRMHLGLGRMALSGGSYGGIIALEYALRHPEFLTHMVLRGTAASQELQDAALENALKADLPGVNPTMLENLFFGRMKDDEDLKEHFAKIFPLYSTTYNPDKLKALFARKRFRARTHNAFFQNAFPQYDIRDRLGEIEVPTLILAGRKDWITPLRFAQELADHLVNVKLIIFEDAGHTINADAPEKFQAVTKAFLRGPGVKGRSVESI